VGRTVDLAGQNYKKSVYPFKIEYCKILGAADYEFGVSLMKLKMEDTKWWTIFEKKLRHEYESLEYYVFGVVDYEI
jgi:hypothetical protein